MTNNCIEGNHNTRIHSESKCSALRLFLSAKFEVLATFEGHLHLVFAHSALQSQDNLLRCLCLLVEDRLGLTTVS